MKYFDTLPKITVTDPTGVSQVYTNLMARASIIGSLLNNRILYYQYDIQDGDTPEIVADKYYGDSYNYWIVLFSNQILDPQWDWPLSSSVFPKYITDKYTEFDPYSNNHHYEKNVTQYDSETQTTTKTTYIIDEDTYNSTQNTVQTINFPTSTCTITTTARAVSYYEYELELNESKRSINLLKKDYAFQIQNELKKLMS
jgi:Base plate wedge protein 53